MKKSSAVIIGESQQNGLFIQSGNFFVKEASMSNVKEYPYLLNLCKNAKLLLAELSDLQKWGTNRLLYSCRVTLSIGLSH